MTFTQDGTGRDSTGNARNDSRPGERTVAGRLGVSGRAVQIALGVLWIIDAILQFQPKMFGTDFISMVVVPNAAGQPAAIGSSITHMSNFLSRDVALWNTVFGLTQLAIGLGLMFRRTVRRALAVSFAWAFGVWWFGEGFGGILTGHATPFTGAPGAVLLYAVIGLLVWPRKQVDPAVPVAGGHQATPSGPEHPITGMASSATGRGPLGGLGGIAIWSAVWVFFAVLQFLPQNRTASWFQRMFDGAAAGQPGWYAHVLDSLGHAFTGAGTPIAVLAGAGFLVIGIGPFVSRRSDVFIVAGMGMGVVFWLTGQGLGGIMTGMGTDPNAGLLLVLLGATCMPTVLSPEREPVPIATALEHHRTWVTAGMVMLAVVPAAVATIPGAAAAVAAPASNSTSGSPSGAMVMAGSSGTGASGSLTTRTEARGGSTANSMNMSGMAGLGVTDPNWRYTGPPLPAAEVSLLTAVSSITDKGHAMQTPDCSTAPTAAQVLGAVQYVQSTSAAVAKYKLLSTALAAGYVPVTSTAYPVVHYVNYRYMNRADVLDPSHVDSLVYAFTPQGPVLVAAMYLMPGKGLGPMPYGCLVQWHAHTNLCTSTTTHQIDGFLPCPAGSVHLGPTPYMTHVWQVPVAGGPLAIDPSDLQVIEAAIMAQRAGLAPVTANPSSA
ncbi:MAG: hypothetical protein ACYDDZ_09870 [Acidimicrobiales bacterium]